MTNEIVTKKNMPKDIKIYYRHKQLHTIKVWHLNEILNRTVWTNKKDNQSNMKDINNIIVDEACSKCGKAEDTDHMILECSYYSEKRYKQST